MAGTSSHCGQSSRVCSSQLIHNRPNYSLSLRFLPYVGYVTIAMVCIIPIFSGRSIDLASPERFSTVKVCASGGHGPLCTGPTGIDLFSRVFNANAHRVCVATPPVSASTNVQIKWDHNVSFLTPQRVRQSENIYCTALAPQYDSTHLDQCFSYRRDSYSFLCTRCREDSQDTGEGIVTL